jgi:hypothetical protein
MTNTQLNQLSELKANLVKEIEQKITEIKELIGGMKSVFPDYQSPLDAPPTTRTSGQGTLVSQLIEFLSIDVAKRASRKQLMEKFSGSFNTNSVDNAVNKLCKTGQIVNGYRVQEIHPAEDTYRSFVKVKVD